MTRYLVIAALFASPVAAQTSAFGCAIPATQSALPMIEGHDGTFFRTFADLRMRHTMEDPIIARMAALSAALAKGGTTLIYVAIPTKSEVMPDQLPDLAADYQFDTETAVLVYEDIITRLTAQGIIAPDILTALSQADPTAPAFFQDRFSLDGGGCIFGG